MTKKDRLILHIKKHRWLSCGQRKRWLKRLDPVPENIEWESLMKQGSDIVDSIKIDVSFNHHLPKPHKLILT